MSDYELYQLLEDNGYKTTETNLEILKEGLDSGEYTLEEGKTIKKLISSAKFDEVDHRYGDDRSNAYLYGKDAGAQKTYGQKDELVNAQIMAGRVSRIKSLGDDAINSRNNSLNKPDTGAHKGHEDRETARKSLKRLATFTEASDYELYQILEANGYKTTEANLEILKEGLENGNYVLDESKKALKK